MSCKIYREMLHSYINDELNALEATAVSEHLEACAACSKEVEEIKRLKVVAAAIKPEIIPISGLKENIMSAIKLTKKMRPAAYDVKVLGRLGASLVACGMLVMVLNFTSLGSNLEARSDKMNYDMQDIGQRITQPMALINEGLIDMSSKLVNLNGITFRLEQKIRGGM